MRNNEQSQRPKTETYCILNIFLYVALFLLCWGLTLQLGRVNGWTLPLTGHVATFTSIAVLLIHLTAFNTNFSVKDIFSSQDLKKAFLLACAVAVYRFFHFTDSSDSMQYLIGAAHHAKHFDLPLGFNMPGHVETDKLNLYYLSQVIEYFVGYLSIFTQLNIVTLYFHLIPAIASFLGILSIYLLFSVVSSTEKHTFLFTLLTACILFLNFGDGFFGEWAIRRTETTRSFFNAFILNLFLCLAILQIRFDNINLTNKAFIFSAGFCFTSQTIPFLIFLTVLILWTASFLQNTLRERIIQLKYKSLFLAISIPAILIILVSQYLTDADLYKYQLEGWKIRSLANNYASYHAHWTKVFGIQSITFIVFVFTFVLHSFLVVRLPHKPISSFMYFYAIIYLLIILNPFSFKIISLLSAKHVVYFRFFYLFPVLTYPFILILTYKDSFKSARITQCALALLLSVFFFVGFEKFWVVTNNFQFKSAKDELTPLITQTMISSSTNIELRDKSLLAFRQSSFKHGVFTTDLLLLVSKNQFLPIYRNQDEATLLDAAQFALSGSWKIKNFHRNALRDVLVRFGPDFVISKASKTAPNVSENVILSQGYRLGLREGNQALFIKNN